MRVIQINTVSGHGSTGRIAENLSAVMEKHGIENAIFYGWYTSACKNAYQFGTKREGLAHKVGARLLGNHGMYSTQATKQLIGFLENYKPDVVHLHNLHGFYLNVEVLFEYLKKNKVAVVWTLHDCWPFTGHCAHFSFAGCEKWEAGCYHCPQRMAYPKMLLDRSKKNWEEKQSIFTGLENLTLVTPSQWLAELTRKSFLGEYPVKVIPNGIDLKVFSPGCTNGNEITKIVLASAKTLKNGDRKGGKYLLELARILGSEYQVNVLGLREHRKRNWPPNLISLPYVSDQKKLAEIYSKSDVFVNPTLEDNFPTVNLEALACGTPVITFDTGGSPESITTQCGAVVPQGDVTMMAQEVKQWCQCDCAGKCCEQAEKYESNKRYGEYIELYKQMTGE